MVCIVGRALVLTFDLPEMISMALYTLKHGDPIPSWDQKILVQCNVIDGVINPINFDCSPEIILCPYNFCCNY